MKGLESDFVPRCERTNSCKNVLKIKALNLMLEVHVEAAVSDEVGKTHFKCGRRRQ